jgi:hypothetical protein
MSESMNAQSKSPFLFADGTQKAHSVQKRTSRSLTHSQIVVVLVIQTALPNTHVSETRV